MTKTLGRIFITRTHAQDMEFIAGNWIPERSKVR
jgi:hypothetical protein